jgi:hypothetical protein
MTTAQREDPFMPSNVPRLPSRGARRSAALPRWLRPGVAVCTVAAEVNNVDLAEIGRWFEEVAPRLASEPSEVAARAVGERLECLDPRVGVEIAELGGLRELVVTAGGDPSRFALVVAVCDVLVAPGWTVRALKPARGFGFALEAEGVEIRGEDLTFEPLQPRDAPEVLGIRIFADAPRVDAVRALAWLVVETGIGERAAAHIRYLEVEPTPLDARRELPIRELGRFVEWHRERCAARPGRATGDAAMVV